MRISYVTLIHLARLGDQDAQNMLQQWEKVEDPTQDPRWEVCFTPTSKDDGIFELQLAPIPVELIKPAKNLYAPNRFATLTGISAAHLIQPDRITIIT